MFLKTLNDEYFNLALYGHLVVSSSSRKDEEYEIRIFSPNPTLYDGMKDYCTLFSSTDQTQVKTVLGQIIHKMVIGETCYSIQEILDEIE